ncbi:MAG: ion channel [Legionellaceae bacterium]|nr:ion channel [Legionellaceae bacterium]
MGHYIEVVIITIIIAFATMHMFYEILHLLLKVIAKKQLSTRQLLSTLWIGVFFAHAVSILLYSAVYWFSVNNLGYPNLEGIGINDFSSYLYYSASTYASLGIGDIYPRGILRFVSSVEVITGLTLISWSAMFTYFAVQTMWEEYRSANN